MLRILYKAFFCRIDIIIYAIKCISYKNKSFTPSVNALNFNSSPVKCIHTLNKELNYTDLSGLHKHCLIFSDIK